MKEKYLVEVKEILYRVVEVEAQSKDEAIDIVEEQYKNEEIVLTGDDDCTYDISIFKSDVNEK